MNSRAFENSSAGFATGNFPKTDFFAIKDADAAVLRRRVDELEAKLKVRDEFKARQGGESEDKESVVAGTLARGLARENEKLAKELASLKQTLAEGRFKNQALASKANQDFGAAEVADLREAVQRLQAELMRKDEFYKKREDATRSKLSHLESLEAAAEDKEKQISSLNDEVGQLLTKLNSEALLVSTLESRLKNATTDNKKLTEDVQSLESQNQQ